MIVSATERFVSVAGGRCRLLEKGAGPIVGVIGGHNGIPRWTPFLEALSEKRRVCVLSPPGFPGSDAHHEDLDGHLDWITATLDLLDAAGVAGGDLIAASIGSMLAADAVAMCPNVVRRLSLTGPYGLYESADPVVDWYAQAPDQQQALLCSNPERYGEAFAPPDDPEEAAQYDLMMYRAATAGARVTWPFGDRGLAKRLHRLQRPVQLLWGEDDRIVPTSYAQRFASRLAVPAQIDDVPGAGHLAWVDKPRECADAVEAFLSQD